MAKNGDDHNNEKVWLIKSAGEIKGPYVYQDIVEGLLSKEFILVDEISNRFNRWRYLRDEEAFEGAINEMKNLDDFRGDKTFTNSTTDVLTEDLSDKILNFKSKGHLLSKVEEQTKRQSPLPPSPPNEPSHNDVPPEKVKRFVSEKELKNKSKRSFLIQAAFMVAILCLVGIYVLQNKKETVLSFDQLKRTAYTKINYGNFGQAKYYLEKANSINGNDDELKYLLAYADIELDDTISALKIVNDLKMTAKKVSTQSQAFNLRGIIGLKNFNLEQAKADFARALELNPKFIQATYNRGVTAYLENNFDKAQSDFNQTFEAGGYDGVLLLSLTEALTRNRDVLKDDETKFKFKDLKAKIEKLETAQYPYRQELLVAMAYLDFYLGNKDEMNKYISQSLTIDPQLTNDHVLDVAYYRGLITWDRLSEWIKVMRDMNSGSSDLKTLYGYAEYRGSEKLKGKDTIEALLQADYSNVPNQILHAYTLLSLNRDEDARAALQPVIDKSDQPLTFYFLAQICLKQKDYMCAKNNFEKVLHVRHDDLGSLAGLGEIYFEEKNYGKVQEELNQGVSLSTTYRPILAVKEKFEERTE